MANRQFARSTHRRGLVRPDTPQGAAELASLESVHAAIAAFLDSHPSAPSGSASLWPLTDVSIYADGRRHSRTRPATRSPDGVIWVGDDAPDAPSLWLEFEGGSTPSRLVEHLERALWASSRWRIQITMVVVTAPVAHRAVVKELQRFDLDGTSNVYAADWPGADLTVRIVRATDLASECLLHGDGLEYRLYAGEPRTHMPARF